MGIYEMLEVAGPGGPTALIVQEWGGSHVDPFPVDVLIREAGRLTNLRALFLGEMSQDQNELSWIRYGDVTPILATFPGLRHLWIRGGEGLRLSPVRHENLRELVLQSAGLPAGVVRAVAASDLPELVELELWLGVADHGGDARIEDLAPILDGRRLPALTRLGLRNAEIADEIADAVASAPVVAGLLALDLSMGTLGDTGAEALLAGQPLTHLEFLGLSHHYMSPETAQRLVDELPAVTVDVDDVQTEEEWGRYTQIAE